MAPSNGVPEPSELAPPTPLAFEGPVVTNDGNPTGKEIVIGLGDGPIVALLVAPPASVPPLDEPPAAPPLDEPASPPVPPVPVLAATQLPSLEQIGVDGYAAKHSSSVVHPTQEPPEQSGVVGSMLLH